MQLDFRTPKGLGEVYANCLRQTLYVASPNWRVIGFKITSADGNLLSSFDIMEDMLQVSTRLSALKLSFDGDDDAPVGSIRTFDITSNKGVLKVSDVKEALYQPRFNVGNADEDILITHKTYGAPIELKLFVRKGQGVMSVDDNRRELQSYEPAKGVSNVMGSRHVQFNRVSFTVTPDGKEDVIAIQVTSNEDEASVLKTVENCRNIIVNCFNNVKVN